MAIERLNYFKGEFLDAADFQCEQKYHLDMRRLHNRSLHTAGVVYGLAVTAGPAKVTISAGMAIDTGGRELIVEAPLEVPVTSAGDIAIKFREDAALDNGDPNFPGKKRWVEAVAAAAAQDVGAVVLAKVTNAATTTVTLDPNFKPVFSGPAAPGDLVVKGNLTVQGETTVVKTEKMQGSVVLGDEDGDTVTVEGTVLTGHSSGKLKINAPVDISGDLSVTGKVDGRDVSSDGTKLDTHTGMVAGNPHGTTAAHVGALPLAGGTISGGLDFGSSFRQMISIYGSGNYGIGMQTGTQYCRSSANFAWYAGGTHSNTELDPGTGGSVSMVIKGSNGYVGIGTAAPGAKLEVAGNIIVSGTVDGVDVAGLKSAFDKRVSSYSQFANLNYKSVTVTSTWTKLLTTSTAHEFTKKNADTAIEVFVNSRFSIGAFTGASGIRFQVRIDDGTAPTFGSDGAMLTAGSSEYLSLHAVFQNLPAGVHTVSLWAYSPSSGSSVATVMVDPGNWGGKIIVKESW